MIHIFYDTYGYITKMSTSTEDQSALNCQEGETVMELDSSINPSDYYVSDGELLQRTPFPTITVSESPTINATITVSGLPDDTRVTWPDSEESRESGSFSFDTPVGGKFGFVLVHAAHLLYEQVTIDVT